MKHILRHSLFFLTFIVANFSLKAQVDGLMFSLVYNGGVAPDYAGTINKFDPLLTNLPDTNVANFTIPTGGFPYGNFIQLKNGLLYGMTPYGGAYSNGFSGGTIVQYNIKTNKDSILYSFNPSDTSLPSTCYGSLVDGYDGKFYGLSYQGGSARTGTLFYFDSATESATKLITLKSNILGCSPAGSPILVNDSMLYCLTTTYSGGYGTIFSYNINTQIAKLCHEFTGAPNDGNYPRGNLLQVNDTMLYGLTENGGTNNKGTLFSFNTHTNIEKVLVNFAGQPTDGATPPESLMQASDSNLYGLTNKGGKYNQGTLFQYNITANTETVLYSFNNSAPDTDGYNPWSDVIQARDGRLYGNLYGGGKLNKGLIFSYDLSSNTKKALYQYDGITGEWPYGDLLEVMTINDSATNNVCSYDHSGSLTANVRGGKPPFTYLWSTGATTSTITNLTSGIYYDTVWDSRGIECISADTVKPLPMALNFNVSNACYDTNDASVAVNVSGGIVPFTYTWSNGATTDTISNLAIGSYTCAIKDAHGCTATSTVVITQAAPLTISNVVATEQTYPYNNGKITVSVTGGIPPGDSAYYYYLWSNGGPYDSSTISNLDSGSYAVCVTSPYGCGSTCDSNIIILTGTESVTNPGNFVEVYPVPSSGLITINLVGDNFENIEITNVFGMPIYKKNSSPPSGENTLHIDLSAQPDGVYILYVDSQQGLLTRKIIIQR